MSQRLLLAFKAISLIIINNLSFSSLAQHTFTSGSLTYSQNFELLQYLGGSWTDNNAFFPGWYTTETFYISNDGSMNFGALYNYKGSSDGDGGGDSAFGTFATDSKNEIIIGIRFVNNTGSPISSLDIFFNGEQWRKGQTTNTLSFSYQLNASDLKSGIWINDTNFDFSGSHTGTATKLQGNLPENKKFINNTLTVNIPDGDEIWLRWVDTNDPGDDQGLAIDDFMIAATLDTEPLPVELSCFSVENENNSTEAQISWKTLTEINNDYFEIERSTDGINFETIGKLEGYGTSSQIRRYVYTDKRPLNGVNYYRLKQVDFNGDISFSEVKCFAVNNNLKSLFTMYPNPTNGTLFLKPIDQNGIPSKIKIYSSDGLLVFEENYSGLKNLIQMNLPDNLIKGIYFLVADVGDNYIKKKFVKN